MKKAIVSPINNSDILTKVFYNQETYMEVFVEDHIEYYKENRDGSFNQISKEQYDIEALGATPMKVTESKKASSKHFLNTLRNIIYTLVGVTIISTSLTGCNTEKQSDTKYKTYTIRDLENAEVKLKKK